MKPRMCTVILFSAAVLCGCAADAFASSPGVASPASAQTSASAAASWSPTVKTILAQSKVARGGTAWDQVHSLRTKAALQLGGITGTSITLKDLVTGRSVRRTTLGSIVIARGYDGNIGWKKAPTSGKASAKTSAAAKGRFATRAYQAEKAWWYRHRWPATIQFIGKKSVHGKTFDVLRITPRGGNAFTMWINATTHLTARIVDTAAYGGTSTTYLSDYRTVEGVKIPFQRVIVTQKMKIVARLKKVALNVPVNSADFALRGQHHDDIAIIGSKDKVTIPFKLVDGLIYVPVTVNGEKFGFVLDSGGSTSILSSRAAKLAGLTSKGSFTAQVGGGSKTSRLGMAKAKRLVLGGKVEIANPSFIITKMPEIQGKNQIDGIFSPGVYRHFVIRIDYVGHTVTFMTHKAFNPSGAGTPVPIMFLGGSYPLAKCSIDGLQGLFMVDTGYPASLTLFSPFSKSHHLYARYQSTPPVYAGSGLGGAVKVRVARGGKLMIGSVVVHNPIVNLSLAAKGKGAFAIKGFDGNIGGRILKRFTVTFDLANKRMYLKPNKFYGVPMKQSLFLLTAGMIARRTDHAYAVARVMKGGPASQAGIKVGDIITAVNGKPAGGVSIASFVTQVLRGTPGTQVKLAVGEGKAAHTVTLTLDRLIPKTGGLEPESSVHGS